MLRSAFFVVLLLSIQAISGLKIYKTLWDSCIVDTSEGILDLRRSAHEGGYKAAFATAPAKDGTVTHWNPCHDTTIKDMKCYYTGQLFQTNNKVDGCETLASSTNSDFSVYNDQLYLNYRNHKDGVDVHIGMNCSGTSFFAQMDNCWDYSGYCYSFTHPDACFNYADPTFIVSAAAGFRGAWMTLLSALSMALLARQMV